MSFLRPTILTVPETSSTTTAIAIDRDRNSQLAVKWAVENLLHRGSSCFLIHVQSQSLHPHNHETVPKEARPPTEADLQHFFLPFRAYVARKGIQPSEVFLHHDVDVPTALVDFINNNNIDNIIVGASSRNVLTSWKLRNTDVPSSLLKSAPESCAVYVISKGRLQTYRLANLSQTPQETETPHKSPLKQVLSTFDSLMIEGIRRTFSSSEGSSNHRTISHGGSRSIEATPHDKLQTNDEVIKLSDSSTTTQSSKSPEKICTSESNKFSEATSWQPSEISVPISDVTTDNDSDPLACLSPRSLEIEMRRLRRELKQSMKMFKSISKEATVAKEEMRMLEEWKAEEERKLEEAKRGEETARSLAGAERQKTKTAMEAAKLARRLAGMEEQKRKLAESKANREEEAKKRALGQLVNNNAVYRRYTIGDIEAATDHFASINKIGEGGYGPVFKGTLDHTAVAIKVLRPDISQGQKQFQQEVEVLSCMRHPHMVLLIGACPEYGCLVYEYMENGSLEDRLFRKDNTPSLPWKTRFRIAAEIAVGLLFFHQTKPEPLVHRDLKPANILLDRNFVSKISDVGLSRLVPASFADSVTQYRLTAARGTFCYIDPEYQQSGMLGVKSDLYSFGVVLLQIITSRPPVGLTVLVQEAIDKGNFAEILDPTVPDWPVEEALSLAKLALQCCELRKRDRPDLDSVVLPELNRLRDLALGHEANKSEQVARGPPVCSSAPLIDSQGSQIFVRRGWRHLKSMTRIWKTSNRRPAAKSNKKLNEVIGCWSFVNCSCGAPQQLREVKAFSSEKIKNYCTSA